MGRNSLPIAKKKKPIRIWFENETIDLLGVEKIREETSKFINHLQSEALTKCSNEALKSKL